MSFTRIVARAERFMPRLVPASFDLVFTSPPAYPSKPPIQRLGALGTERSLELYLAALHRFIRRSLLVSSSVVLVIEELPGHPVREHLVPTSIPRKCVKWIHGDRHSWVILLGQAVDADVPATWNIPRPPPDRDSVFFQWPDELVRRVLAATLPDGGSLLDPYAGPAKALQRLGAEYDVTVVDIVQSGTP